MKRLLAVLATAATVATAKPAHAAEGPCADIPWRRGPAQVRVLIRCVWNRFDVGHGDAPKAIAVANCESTLRPAAVGGDNLGLFQHKARYWPGRVERYVETNRLRRTWGLSSSAFDARTNAIVTALYVRNIGSWNPWGCRDAG